MRRRTALKLTTLPWLVPAAGLLSGCGFMPRRKQFRHVLDMVYDNPGEAPTETWFKDPENLVSWGYTGAVPPWMVQCALTYDGFHQGIVPVDTPERAWIERHAAKITDDLARYRRAGLQVFPFTDFLVVPTSLWRSVGNRMIDRRRARPDAEMGGAPGRGIVPDIRRKMTQTIVRAQIDELFQRFPDLGGITLRFGETYLHDAPHHHGGRPLRDGFAGVEDHVLLLELLRQEICVARDKVLFYRTWDFGDHFHTNPEFYLAVTERIRPHPNLVFSIKHTRGDFFRSVPFNPCLGIGRHLQQVEVQCQREYEGKGAHPAYVAHDIIESTDQVEAIQDRRKPHRLRDLVGDPKVMSLWTWSRGGGWEGPYIADEFWVELETYVISHWAQDPSRPERYYFDAFARSRGFERENLVRLRRVCELSHEGVLKGHYDSEGKTFIIIARDDCFGVPSERDLSSRLALREKTEAVEIWKQIETIGAQIEVPDPGLQAFIRTSCTYGRIKYALMEAVWNLADLDQAAARGGKFRSIAVRKWLDQYDALWREWRELARRPECSTLYKDVTKRTAAPSPRRLVARLRRRLGTDPDPNEPPPESAPGDPQEPAL